MPRLKAVHHVQREKHLRERGFGPLLEEICARHHCLPSEVMGTARNSHIVLARAELLLKVRESVGSDSAAEYVTGFTRSSLHYARKRKERAGE
jgi:hypothetical protein